MSGISFVDDEYSSSEPSCKKYKSCTNSDPTPPSRPSLVVSRKRKMTESKCLSTTAEIKLYNQDQVEKLIETALKKYDDMTRKYLDDKFRMLEHPSYQQEFSPDREFNYAS